MRSVALRETRDCLHTARQEFIAGFSLHRHLALFSETDRRLTGLESGLMERGLCLLRDALRTLVEEGRPDAARECVASACTMFEELGGYDKASSEAAAMVEHRGLVRDECEDDWEEEEEGASAVMGVSTRSRNGSNFHAAGVREDASGAAGMSAGEGWFQVTLLGGTECVVLPPFTDMSQVSSDEVDSLLRVIHSCERSHREALKSLSLARHAISSFMFGIARRHAEHGLRVAQASFAHDLVDQFNCIDQVANALR
jgi:hypothetical protein